MLVVFILFVVVALAAFVGIIIWYDARAYRATRKLRKQKEQEARQYHPFVRAKVEEDRRYELATRKLDLEQDKFRLESFIALTRVDTAQYGTYLINQETVHLTQLAPIHKPLPAKEEPIQLAAPLVQRPSQDVLLSALEQNHEPWSFSPGVRKDDGSVVIVSLVKVPHLKLVGSTGFGKSCLAGAVIDQSTELNSPKKLQLALLDLEHKTSRLYEDLPHVFSMQVGKRLVQMVATNADEVAEYTGYLKKELDRRAGLSQQELRRTPILLMYVEEMLALSYEPFDAKTLARLFANLTLLAVRGRKYGMFLLAAMQIDYSTEELKVASKMFRFRGAAAVDVSAAKASGFINTDLIKRNFQTAQKGEFVVEFPSFSNIVVAPDYDVEALLNKKDGVSDEEDELLVNGDHTWSEQRPNTISEHGEAAWKAKVDEVRPLYVQKWGKIAIIEKVWHAQRGDNKSYRNAEKEYERIVTMLEQEQPESEEQG